MGEEEEEDVGKRQPVGPNETGVKNTLLGSKVSLTLVNVNVGGC